MEEGFVSAEEELVSIDGNESGVLIFCISVTSLFFKMIKYHIKREHSLCGSGMRMMHRKLSIPAPDPALPAIKRFSSRRQLPVRQALDAHDSTLPLLYNILIIPFFSEKVYPVGEKSLYLRQVGVHLSLKKVHHTKDW